eukprot:scaffold254721_cov45-Tisochrysis_lutea.AAC.1
MAPPHPQRRAAAWAAAGCPPGAGALARARPGRSGSSVASQTWRRSRSRPCLAPRSGTAARARVRARDRRVAPA